MRPVVTPEEMAAIDAEASDALAVLIDRAGWAVARAALALLSGGYGRRVLVIAGKGNNGADGRSAAAYLQRRGVRCTVLTPDEAAAATATPEALAGHDLVIDAAYGTGFRGTYVAPEVTGAPVLAVDIPSGVDGLTGAVGGSPSAATATVTFAAPKPGLLFEPGRSLAGRVTVADIGLDCSRAQCWLLDDGDLDAWPRADAASHKWQRAVWIIGGSPGLDGAPGLAARSAARAGAGYVAVTLPGDDQGRLALAPSIPIEAVRRPAGSTWSAEVLADRHRFAALVIGPGLAVDQATKAEVMAVTAGSGDQPIVLDGGAIDAVAADPSALAGRSVPAVLTPHDGEFTRLVGHRPGPDRIGEARAAAAALKAVVALKGPTTVVAHPDGRALVSAAGDQRLASAGTGDVLAGLIGAGLAGGLDPLDAAGLGAELHGRAATVGGSSRGLMAADLPPLVAAHLDRITDG